MFRDVLCYKGTAGCKRAAAASSPVSAALQHEQFDLLGAGCCSVFRSAIVLTAMGLSEAPWGALLEGLWGARFPKVLGGLSVELLDLTFSIGSGWRIVRQYLCVGVLLLLWGLVLGESVSPPIEGLGGSWPEGLSIGPSQVLLPWVPPSHASNFPAVRAQLQLEGFNGSPQGGAAICFYWVAQNPQVVSLLQPDCSSDQPAAACRLDGDVGRRGGSMGSPPVQGWVSGGRPSCFSRVLVEAAPQSLGRRASSWVFASAERGLIMGVSDLSSVSSSSEGSLLPAGGGGGQGIGGLHRRGFRAQVLVAPIVRLSFSTRDKRLAIGQLGDVSLLAYDEEGNVFSSLEGLPFSWHIEGPSDVVAIEPVATDAVAGTPARRLVEAQQQQHQQNHQQPWEEGEVGIRSDAIVLRGLRTGRVLLRARLALKEYGDVAAAEVSFLVHEVFSLQPTHLLLPPAATFNIRLLRLWVSTQYTLCFLSINYFNQLSIYIYMYFILINILST